MNLIQLPGRQLVTKFSEACKISANGTYDFLWPATDISAYAGVEGTKASYLAHVWDGAGKRLVGYLGAAGAAKTLGAEVFSDANCTSPASEANATTGWTNHETSPFTTFESSAVDKHDGTYSLHAVANANSQSCRYQKTVTVGTLYYAAPLWYKIVNGDADSRAYIALTNPAETTFAGSGTSVGDTEWTAFDEAYFTADSTTILWRVTEAGTGDDVELYIDETSLKPVTDCPATALHVWKDQTCATRGWLSKDTGFNYKAASYTVQIFKVR